MQATDLFAVLQQIQRVLEGLTSTRGRLAVSLVVVVTTLVLVGVLVPAIVRRLRGLVESRYVSGPVADTMILVGEYVPTTLSDVALRAVQLALVVGMALALLVVWGLVDVAILAAALVLTALPGLVNLAVTILLLIAAYIGSDQLRGLIDRFSAGADQVTEHQEEILLRVGQLALFVTVGGTILTLWGVNLSGLLVGAGFLGIVIGFAARQTLGSLIAGFVLMFSRPFTIGDWIEVGDQEGIVTDITIFNTRIENFDGEFVIIPNDRVSDRAVTNRSKKGMLRLRTDVGIDYDADPEHAERVAMDAMEDAEVIAPTPPPQVIPKGFGDSAVVLELRYWIDHPTPPRKWRAVSAVVREVKAVFDEEGIEIPFPQRTLSDREGGVDGLGDE